MAQELKRNEYEAGRKPLEAKVRRFRPLIVAFAGRMAATGYYGKPRALGPQEEKIEGAYVFVAPSPSAANKAHHPDADLYQWYARLREFRDDLKRKEADNGR
jgi:uracil-DNA glycosylase